MNVLELTGRGDADEGLMLDGASLVLHVAVFPRGAPDPFEPSSWLNGFCSSALADANLRSENCDGTTQSVRIFRPLSGKKNIIKRSDKWLVLFSRAISSAISLVSPGLLPRLTGVAKAKSKVPRQSGSQAWCREEAFRKRAVSIRHIAGRAAGSPSTSVACSQSYVHPILGRCPKRSKGRHAMIGGQSLSTIPRYADLEGLIAEHCKLRVRET